MLRILHQQQQSHTNVSDLTLNFSIPFAYKSFFHYEHKSNNTQLPQVENDDDDDNSNNISNSIKRNE